MADRDSLQTLRTVFNTDRAAVTGGPYSQAVIHNGLIYLSGQGALDPVTNQISPGTIESETELGLENIRGILEEAGTSLARVLTVTVYLLKMEEYVRFNRVYERFFPTDPPARTCVQAAKLPFGLRVELEVVAAI